VIILDAGATLSSQAAAASAITVTVWGRDGTTYKLLNQQQVPASATTLYTATGITLVNEIACVNSTGTDRTIRFWTTGTTDADLILPPTNVPAGGTLLYDGSGWKVIDANGHIPTTGGIVPLIVQEADTTVDSNVTTLDFDGASFNVTSSPAGEANIERAALTGDVTAAAGSGATTIANDAVTYAKMQNVSATDRLLGRDTAAAGDVEELAVGSGLAFTGGPGLDLAAHGASYHTDVQRNITASILADGSTLVSLGSVGTSFTTRSMADGSTQGIVTTFYMPADAKAASPLLVDIHWFPSASDATSKAVRWTITAAVIAAGTTATTAGTATSFTGSTAAKVTDTRFDEAQQTALASVSAGDLIRLTIHRIGADAADTYTGAVRIAQQAVLVSYTATG
jgi:hypothetical protein